MLFRGSNCSRLAAVTQSRSGFLSLKPVVYHELPRHITRAYAAVFGVWVWSSPNWAMFQSDKNAPKPYAALWCRGKCKAEPKAGKQDFKLRTLRQRSWRTVRQGKRQPRASASGALFWIIAILTFFFRPMFQIRASISFSSFYTPQPPTVIFSSLTSSPRTIYSLFLSALDFTSPSTPHVSLEIMISALKRSFTSLNGLSALFPNFDTFSPSYDFKNHGYVAASSNDVFFLKKNKVLFFYW